MARERTLQYYQRRRWIVRGVIALVVVAAAVRVQMNASNRAATVNAPGAQVVSPFTGFGGYVWSGTVHQISAQWRVPTISSESPRGYASTWIGAQSNANNQLIQVGLLEQFIPEEAIAYEAFWSDLAVGYAPQTFGRVTPGDVVALSMVRSHQGWTLTIDDTTHHLTGKRFVPFASSVTFNRGEWLQEDPSPSTQAAEDLPYPVMTNVTFEKLMINGVVPSLGLADAQVLVTSGGTIRVPSALSNDGFALKAPRGAAAQYLRDEEQFDNAVSAFNAQLASWSTTSKSAKASTTDALARAIASYATTVTTQSWPSTSSVAVAQLAHDGATQVANLATWSREGFPTRGAKFARFQGVLVANEQLQDTLRATLRLPPL